MSGQEQDTSPVSKRFVQELKRTGLTNQQAARALLVSERQVTRWRGGQEPRYGSVVRMARVFGRPVTWFYGERCARCSAPAESRSLCAAHLEQLDDIRDEDAA